MSLEPPISHPDRRCRILRHRRRHQARQGGTFRLPPDRSRRRSGWHLALEHLSRYRRGYPVVLLSILLRAEPAMVTHLRAGPGAEGLRRTLRRQIRHPIADPVQHQGHFRRVRRRASAVAGADGSGRRGHGQIPDQRQRRAHRAEPARHRRRGLLRRPHHAHRTLGSQPGPDRQARRHHRHRRLGRADHPGNRANCRPAHRISAHSDLVLPQIRRPAAGAAALGNADSRRALPSSGCSVRRSSS